MQIKVNVQVVPVEKLFPNIWNPNRQTDFIFSKEIESIKTHGFVAPILVREIEEGFEIIDGEHRWKAAKQLGFESVAINNMGHVSDSVAKQLTVIMNEVKGKADSSILADLLRDLEKDIGKEALLAAMPYSQVELDTYLNSAGIDWDSLGKKDPLATDSDSPNIDSEEWRTVSFNLPEGVADQLEAQIRRFKKRLHPDDKPENCSPVQAIEAICQTLSQMDDENLF